MSNDTQPTGNPSLPVLKPERIIVIGSGSPNTAQIAALLSKSVNIEPSLVGQINEKGEVTNLTIRSFNLVADPE